MAHHACDTRYHGHFFDQTEARRRIMGPSFFAFVRTVFVAMPQMICNPPIFKVEQLPTGGGSVGTYHPESVACLRLFAHTGQTFAATRRLNSPTTNPPSSIPTITSAVAPACLRRPNGNQPHNHHSASSPRCSLRLDTSPETHSTGKVH
jgi:hypothetical protein